MGMLSDIEIAQNTNLQPIREITGKLGLSETEWEPYGTYKAKLNQSLYQRLSSRKNGRLILVTAINPTPAGEGKTTMTIGLTDALARMGKKVVAALREPSLGPVFGIKGGAAGGGYAQVVPMEDINLHFTGDFHAITSANNLLCALLDNHIQQGNLLQIDPRRVVISRCMDMNDRQLRSIVTGLGSTVNGVPRQDSFCITAATEMMAIFCLAEDLDDLKHRIGNMLVAYSYAGQPVYARDLHAQGAMTALLVQALNPNLVQTLEGTPVLIHGGPFANIAHGCNSIRATRLAMKLGDYCVTEAGFGSDLGAEKFLDIKCRICGLKPDVAVLVATTRALKYNGGIAKADTGRKNLAALEDGIANLGAHIDIIKKYGLPVVVALNRFQDESEEEIAFIENFCRRSGVDFAVSSAFENGGAGSLALAEKVCSAAESQNDFQLLYDSGSIIPEKVEKICKEIYGADGVNYTGKAIKSLGQIQKLGGDDLPVCIAKTQYSLSDKPSLLGRPFGFTVEIRDFHLNGGAGFVVAYAGEINTMPGLPRIPAAENIDVDSNGKIKGLF